MATVKKEEKKPIKTGASSSQISNLKQSILETFNIYDSHSQMKLLFYNFARYLRANVYRETGCLLLM
jgi:hypothetical protein